MANLIPIQLLILRGREAPSTLPQMSVGHCLKIASIGTIDVIESSKTTHMDCRSLLADRDMMRKCSRAA